VTELRIPAREPDDSAASDESTNGRAPADTIADRIPVPESLETDGLSVPSMAHEPAAADDAEVTIEPARSEESAADEPSPVDDSTVADVPPPPAPAALPSTVAVTVARQLRAAGVRFAFTVPGESFLALLEAFAEEGIRVVTTRHENGAAFMAEAYGQLTGRPAVALGTRAVGAANMAIGVHTARQDSSPMVVIVGQVQRRLRGREAFQEVDLVQSFGRLAKWATEVSDRDAVSATVEDVLRHLRTGRPGPVMLSLPEDLLDELVPPAAPPPARARSLDLESSAVRAVLHMLAGAQRPVILAGAGVLRARATNDLVQVAEMLEVPVITAWRRPDAFPNHHPLYLGMTGFGAASTVLPRLREADALLVLGSRLNEIASFDYAIPAKSQQWAHVDLEPRTASHGLSAPTIAIPSDVRGFLRSAIERLKGGVLEAAGVDERAAGNRRDREQYEAASAVDLQPWDGPGVHPGRVVATLSSVLAPDTIVTTDAGNFASWAARGYKFHRPATFIGPTSGAMGFGLPAAIAAALARPNRPAIALTGDGGFAMTMAELETAVRERARVVAIVFDNQRFGTIRAHQERRGRGVAGTDLGPIDFAAVAEAFGARGIRVESDAQFEPALREALAHSGPSVVHLVLDRRWLAIDQVLDT